MTYRHRREPGDEGDGAWLAPPGTTPPAPPYEGADVIRAYRHWKNHQHGIARPLPTPTAWDRLHATLCERQRAAGGDAPPPRPWHHEPDAETVPHRKLRAWDRWYETCAWAVRHGYVDLLPPRISETRATTTDLPRPYPGKLNDVYNAMCEWADEHPCEPSKPPKPLILGAYWDSTEDEKDRRWREMITWAERNGCAHVLDMVSDETADDPMIRRLGRDWREPTKNMNEERKEGTDA